MNPRNYFLWGYLKDRVYCTNPHNVHKLQVETEAVAEEITLHDTVHTFVACLQ